MRSLEERLLSKVSFSAATFCWEWEAAKFREGYGKIWVSGGARLAHRVSYQIHCGPIPSGMLVCHSCDNPSCVNPEHLFLGTNADNMADRDAKGRQQRGAAHYFATLTEADVIAIRGAADVPQRELAARYGVSPSQISSIRSGRSWAHIDPPQG